MIRNSFVLLNGISNNKELNLWNEGIVDWDSFVRERKISGISKKRKLVYNYHLYQAKQALMLDDSTYFANLLPMKEHWRLYENFKDSCIFLDIETSHVDKGYITCITLYDGYKPMTFVKGHNLDFKTIGEILAKHKMIVTFNGNVFDLPFLRKQFHNLIPNIPCWDLRHSCAKLDMGGGLKQVEKILGIERKNKVVEKMYGGDPIKLWRTYMATGDDYYLELLVEYNQEDTMNLQTIADKIYGMLKENSIS